MLVSAQALIVALFGGVGVYWGPVIGAAVLVPLAETLHAELGHIVPGIQGVVYGVAIIVIILLAPEGIYWRIRDRFSRRAGRVPPRRRRAGAGASPVGRGAARNSVGRAAGLARHLCSSSTASCAPSAASRPSTASA